MESSFLTPEARKALVAAELCHWYTETSVVRRLWAIELRGLPPAAEPTLLVRVLLEPTPDGNEAAPIWLANSRDWILTLRARIAESVQLELVEGLPPDELDSSMGGPLITSQHWRDHTAFDD